MFYRVPHFYCAPHAFKITDHLWLQIILECNQNVLHKHVSVLCTVRVRHCANLNFTITFTMGGQKIVVMTMFLNHYLFLEHEWHSLLVTRALTNPRAIDHELRESLKILIFSYILLTRFEYSNVSQFFGDKVIILLHNGQK